MNTPQRVSYSENQLTLELKRYIDVVIGDSGNNVKEFFKILRELLMGNSQEYHTPFNGKLANLMDGSSSGIKWDLHDYLDANLYNMLLDADKPTTDDLTKIVKLSVLLSIEGTRLIWRQAVIRLLARWCAKKSGDYCGLTIKTYKTTYNPLNNEEIFIGDYWIEIENCYGDCDHAHILGFEIEAENGNLSEGRCLSILKGPNQMADLKCNNIPMLNPILLDYENLDDDTLFLHHDDFIPFRLKIEKHGEPGLYIKCNGNYHLLRSPFGPKITLKVHYRDHTGIKLGTPIAIDINSTTPVSLTGTAKPVYDIDKLISDNCNTSPRNIFILKDLFDIFGDQTKSDPSELAEMKLELIKTFLKKCVEDVNELFDLEKTLGKCKNGEWLDKAIDQLKGRFKDVDGKNLTIFLNVLHEIHHSRQQGQNNNQKGRNNPIRLISTSQIKQKLPEPERESVYAIGMELQKLGWVRYCELKVWPNNQNTINGTRSGWILLVKLSLLTKEI